MSDVHLFENEFSYTDFVFISAGVNDLSRYGWNGASLSQYFKNLLKKYPKTQFIFNSVLLTNRSWLNKDIEKLNNELFHFSLNPKSNLWFYDSHHIAHTLGKRGFQVLETNSRRANGVHLTYRVTDEIRANIIYCLSVLCVDKIGDLRTNWPLRHEFRMIANNF